MIDITTYPRRTHVANTQRNQKQFDRLKSSNVINSTNQPCAFYNIHSHSKNVIYNRVRAS